MRGLLKFRYAPLLAAAFFIAECAAAGQIVSTSKNVSAVMQARGFYLAPARYASVAYSPTGRDLAPVQSFEIIRPRGEKVTIGRLYTSCTCVQLETSKRTFERGEPAVLNLHNVIATPPGGQNYAIYVQITSPIRATLRIDTFVQSSQFVSQAPAALTIGSEPETIIPEAMELEIVGEPAGMAAAEEEKQSETDLDAAERGVQEKLDEAKLEVEEARLAEAEEERAETEALEKAEAEEERQREEAFEKLVEESNEDTHDDTMDANR